MNDDLVGRDLRPFDGLTAADAVWLRDLQAAIRADDLVIEMGSERREEDTPIVWCAPNGEWWAGRYVGMVSFRGRRLTIQPRVGMDVLAHWLATAMNIVLTPAAASLRKEEAFLPALMAHVWSQAIVQAARHGLPYLRVETEHTGLVVRGRLDVRRTAQIRRRLHPGVASTDRDRTLDHDLGRVLVSAERALARALKGTYWQSQRLKELLGSVRSAVGARPRTPTEFELRRIRYTPIRLPWKPVAQLSRHIAMNRGLLPAADESEGTGVLIDVAELWELFLLKALRQGLAPLRVRHGTHDLRTSSPHLLQSRKMPGRGLGRLLPDYVIEDPVQGGPMAVLDAKYKSLSPTVTRRSGVDRGDLYQLTAYLSRFGSQAPINGALLYPDHPDTGDAPAEDMGPWLSPADGTVWFTRCPLILDEAVPFLADKFGREADGVAHEADRAPEQV